MGHVFLISVMPICLPAGRHGSASFFNPEASGLTSRNDTKKSTFRCPAACLGVVCLGLYYKHRAGENKTVAAQILGIDRVSLWRKLKRYGLETD